MNVGFPSPINKIYKPFDNCEQKYECFLCMTIKYQYFVPAKMTIYDMSKLKMVLTLIGLTLYTIKFNSLYLNNATVAIYEQNQPPDGSQALYLRIKCAWHKMDLASSYRVTATGEKSFSLNP